MTENNTSTPQVDDVSNVNGQTEAELLDAVLNNTEFLKDDEVPLPEEEITEVDPAETDTEEDPVESEEVVSEDEEESTEEVEESEGEDAVEETATQETEDYSVDDLDLDAKINGLKINGEVIDGVSFGDLIKSYQTDQHLSKKGRELGEATKALEAEKEAKLKEVTDLAQATGTILYGTEQSAAKEFHELESQIEKARKDGDDFEMNNLKDKREQVQKKYWEARHKREGIIAQVQKQQQAAQEEYWKTQLDNFQKEIPNLIPDFNEDVADKIRKFAIDKGIKPEILNQITDPAIVKFVDDFRRLSDGVTKGAAKRKVVPSKKTPAKKAPSASKKEADKANMVKARAFKENSSSDDQMAFLKQYASNSLNNL